MRALTRCEPRRPAGHSTISRDLHRRCGSPTAPSPRRRRLPFATGAATWSPATAASSRRLPARRDCACGFGGRQRMRSPRQGLVSVCQSAHLAGERAWMAGLPSTLTLHRRRHFPSASSMAVRYRQSLRVRLAGRCAGRGTVDGRARAMSSSPATPAALHREGRPWRLVQPGVNRHAGQRRHAGRLVWADHARRRAASCCPCIGSPTITSPLPPPCAASATPTATLARWLPACGPALTCCRPPSAQRPARKSARARCASRLAAQAAE